MATKDAPGPITPIEDLKPLLHLARRKPLNCAIAMDRTKQGHILLHRRTKPKKLLAELKRQAKAAGVDLDLTSVRFGRAFVDGASDSGKVTFTVNKPTPGPMTRAMLEQVRPAGLQRCEIVVDEALEDESDDEAAEDGAGSGEHGAAPGAASEQGAGFASRAPVEPGASQDAGAEGTRPSGRVGATPPAATGVAPPSTGGARYGTGHPIFDKGRQAWMAVRVKLQGDIDAALKAMVADYGEGDPRVQAIHERVEPIMRQLDDSLARKLGEVTQNAAPDVHSRLVGEAEAIIGRYRAFADGEAMVAALDGNPFHPMTMQKTLDAALAALSKAVAAAT